MKYTIKRNKSWSDYNWCFTVYIWCSKLLIHSWSFLWCFGDVRCFRKILVMLWWCDKCRQSLLRCCCDVIQLVCVYRFKMLSFWLCCGQACVIWYFLAKLWQLSHYSEAVCQKITTSGDVLRSRKSFCVKLFVYSNFAAENPFHKGTCFYVSLYVETYKDLHDNNIWNWGLEFYVKIIRKTLNSLKPKAPFPWAWHLKDRFNSDSCKNGRDTFCID